MIVDPNKTRIALVNQDLFRLGAQYVTSLIAEGLSKRGYQIDLVLSKVHEQIAQERPDLSPFPIPEKVRVIHLPNLRASRNILALSNYFRHAKPTIVIPMTPTYTRASVLASFLTMRRLHILPVEHSGGIVAYAKRRSIFPSRNICRRVGERIFASWYLSRVDRIIAVSHGTADELRAVYGLHRTKISVVHNPVINEAFEKKRGCPPDHPWLMNGDIPVIVAAGAHVKIKGYDVLIRAFAEILRHRQCRLILFGEGAEHQNLVNLAMELGLKENISFPGYSQNLPGNIAKASVFVVSSHFESFSIVLIEALACRTPVVATNCQSGPPELLAGGKYGILVRPNDPDAMAKGILQVLDGKGIVPPVGSWKPYCLDNIIDQYESVIREILTSPGATT